MAIKQTGLGIFVANSLVMIKVKAAIKLYKMNGGRTIPFHTGYRPLFNFIPEMKTSGQITLIARQEFPPGEEDIVEIVFISSKYLGSNFGPGSKFTFGESLEPLGEGEVKEVLER